MKLAHPRDLIPAQETVMTQLKYPHVDYSALPEHMQDGARLYVEHGVPPGSFMTAVICNDLREACGRADHINSLALPSIVSWFYNEAPAPCWGSEEKMDAWMAARTEERRTGDRDE